MRKSFHGVDVALADGLLTDAAVGAPVNREISARRSYRPPESPSLYFEGSGSADTLVFKPKKGRRSISEHALWRAALRSASLRSNSRGCPKPFLLARWFWWCT